MKKIIIITLILFIFVKPMFAQEEATSSPTPKDKKLELIRDLKEKVAKKISQLKTNKRNVFSGEIKKINKDSIGIITTDGDKNLDVLTITKYFWINKNGKRLTISLNNLEIGDFIAAFGETDDIGTTIITEIIGKDQSFFLNGTITKVISDGQNLTLSFKERDTPMTVIISPLTDIKIYSGTEIIDGKNKDIIKDLRAIIRGNYKENSKEEISAQRIIIYSKLKENNPTPTITPTPSY